MNIDLKEYSSNKIKHLDYIQNIITRMNTNSFQIKTWTVSIVTALLAITISSKNSWFILLAIIPTIVLWLLDAYYLNMERKFRKLYNDVVGISKEPKIIKDFDMNIKFYRKGFLKYLITLFAPSLYLLYGGMIILLIIINQILLK